MEEKNIIYLVDVIIRVLLIVGSYSAGRFMVISKVALKRGSSNDGKTMRAYVGSICVVATHLSI